MQKELEIISLIKEASLNHNDEELLYIAQIIEKNAGLGLYETIQAAKGGIKALGRSISSATEKVAPGLANTLNKSIPEIAHSAGNAAAKVAPAAAAAGVNFMHQGKKVFMAHSDLAKKSAGFQQYVNRNLVK